MFAPWWKFSTDAMMLALEAQGVIAMRLTSIALGRGTHAENSSDGEREGRRIRGGCHDHGDWWVGARGQFAATGNMSGRTVAA